ncbi:PREDICTED: uncharacterized protein LOC109478951 [Branchiostoma belcheri]|uniref:Uncharacterized protein LOC109478951 n=1 Tax=Branchiostoma belcheri TaxID=7741 RepID=A0A6P4ZZD1_BRABE|nr:PREDICTED: uncharacterized protein LOC109478951 [Branchiostoma belcheri]
MLNVVIVVFSILVSGASLDPTCFPGCKNTKSWSSCIPNYRHRPGGPGPREDACILCTSQLQQQSVLNLNNSSQHTSTCLPNNYRVAVRGFSFGILSVQKLRPSQKKSKVSELALIECGITDVEQDLLAEFPKLQTLRLDYNNLTYVKQNWFSGERFTPEHFHVLSLSHNYISNMDSKCFQILTSLHTLILDSNSLQSVQPSWFHNLKWLGTLSLKSNSIKTIHPQAFKPLSGLGDLDLSMNELTCLSSETLEGLQKLDKLSLGGDSLEMTWRLGYRFTPYYGQRIAVRVNEVLFCITEFEVPQLKKFYNVQMQHNTQVTQATLPGLEPNIQCNNLDLKGPKTKRQLKYSLPLILLSVNNTESDIKPAQNITHLCQQAWENVSTVRVALGGDITLQIVPMGLDRSCHPQTVAIVISNVISKENRTRLYDHEEMTNVTCLVNTWEEETYQHVFIAPLSSTPDGTVCPRKTQATRTPDSTLFTREGMPLTTIEPKITTTKLSQNQTTCTCTVCTCSPYPNGTVKERSPHVAIIIMGTVIGVVLVELLVVYVIRRQRCCTATQEPPPAAPFPNCWLMGGPGPLAGARGTAPNRTTQQSGEQQYSEIPDEYYDQQNTPQTDHDYNYYNTIPDEYYNRYNTYPPTRRIPQDDRDYSVRLNTAAAEVVLPSSTRLGGKHPSYDTAPQVWRDPQNYQIPARGRQTNIRPHRILVPQTGNSGHQYMGLLGNCRYNRRPLSYPQILHVPQRR